MKITSCDCFEENIKTSSDLFVIENPDGKYDVYLNEEECMYDIKYCPFCGKKIEVKKYE